MLNFHILSDFCSVGQSTLLKYIISQKGHFPTNQRLDLPKLYLLLQH